MRVKLRDAKPSLRDGDLLLYRSNGLIARLGRGDYNHAAKLGKWGDDWFVLDTTWRDGVQMRLLDWDVHCWPGVIDVYRPNPDGRWQEYDARASVMYLREKVCCGYGRASVLKACLLRLPIVRLFCRVSTDDKSIDDHPPFCSQLVVMGERLRGGVDPVPSLADRFTEPSDLARSPFYRYQFTLT